MRIALTGASGFIGSFLCREAKSRGHAVTALVRESSRRDHIAPFVDQFVVGDHSDQSKWPALLELADAVVHNSVDAEALGPSSRLPPAHAYARHLESNLGASLMLLRASAPLPFVFMSTIAVHHDMRPRWEGRIDEDHPLRPNTDYGAYKAAVEAFLWAEHFDATPARHVAAIRPCAVYGIDPDLPRSRGHAVIEAVRSGRPFTKPGGGKFVHVEDVASATISAAERPDASGMAFNLVDCYARHADWARMACEVLGTRVEIDASSPASPKNEFSKERTHRVLGVEMERGHDGIREHLRELAAVVG